MPSEDIRDLTSGPARNVSALRVVERVDQRWIETGGCAIGEHEWFLSWRRKAGDGVSRCRGAG